MSSSNPQPSPEALAWLANREKAVAAWREARAEGMEFEPESDWDPNLVQEPLRSELLRILGLESQLDS